VLSDDVSAQCAIRRSIVSCHRCCTFDANARLRLLISERSTDANNDCEFTNKIVDMTTETSQTGVEMFTMVLQRRNDRRLLLAARATTTRRKQTNNKHAVACVANRKHLTPIRTNPTKTKAREYREATSSGVWPCAVSTSGSAPAFCVCVSRVRVLCLCLC
jgi:hypothetical protein